MPNLNHAEILVVDDEADFRRTLVDILEAMGYRVSQAEDGEAAVESVKGWRYKLVVMDIRMPGKDGPSALLDMARLQPGMPVVMVTAYRPDEREKPLMEKQAVAVLNKPLDMDSFLSLVERYCPRNHRGPPGLAPFEGEGI